MKVSELIDLLGKCDPNAPVVFDYDMTDEIVRAVQRRDDGAVELINRQPHQWALVWRERGDDVLFPPLRTCPPGIIFPPLPPIPRRS